MSTPDLPPVIVTAVLRWLAEHNDRGVFCTDTALRVLNWNGWLIEQTGLPAEAVVGRPLFQVFPSLAERGFEQYYAEALAGEIKILSHSLHRFIFPNPNHADIAQRAQIGPLEVDSRVVGTITIVEDVAERVAVERELRTRIRNSEEARITAENASRVKDEFLATLSHEIRTPLNAVLGWTRILQSRECDRSTFDRAIAAIDRNASAQLTLVSDMLDISRIAAGKLRLEVEDLDPSTVALAAIDVIRPAADAKRLQLVTMFEPGVPMIRADRDRLLQVVWNLLSNAVKFTEAGGRVQLSLTSTSGSVQLIVSDTGAGIAAEFLPHMFERFKQADSSSARRHGGLGLGLALVRELVELHGGTVSAASDGPGLGTTVTVRLPAHHSRRVVNVADGAVREPSLEGVRLLIVDDELDSRELLLRAVTDSGAAAIAVGSVAEAIALLRDRPVDIRAIVADIGMPGDDGFTLLRQVRQLPPSHGGLLPVIAVTAYVTAEDRRRALEAGFVAQVDKPFVPRTLVSTIARTLEVAAAGGAVTRVE